MTDVSEIGRFGTLRLLKRNDPTTTIAFFPIDDEEVTFGRSSQCSIRLYYAFVSEVHCLLRISEERKAFLVVKGANGVTIDGCEVVPELGHEPTVPLTNGSEIEIHKKRFKFEYPPKEIRAALLSTPRTSARSRRSLRMSMIASAQVFSPQKNTPLKTTLKSPYPYHDDDDRWNMLKSPVKVPSAFNEHETMLIEGSGEDAVVVEEEKDLIILEHVDGPPEAAIPAFSPKSVNAPPAAAPAPATPKPIATPPRVFPISPRGFKTPPNSRRKSGISLHRAVVLRSAHRVYLERERQRSLEQIEDEQEEEEVEFAVSPERDLGPFELHGDNDEEEDEIGKDLIAVTRDDGEEGVEVGGNELDDEASEDEDEDEEEDEDEKRREEKTSMTPSSQYTGRSYSKPLETLKAGFDMVKKLTFERSPERVPSSPEDNAQNRSPSPVRRTLNAFMTPQISSKPARRVPVDVKPRQTLAGGEILPSLFGGARRVLVETTKEQGGLETSTPKAHNGAQNAKPQITSEERQQILERRRSALQTPVMLPPPAPRSDTTSDDDYVPGRDNEDAETMLAKMKLKLETMRRKSEARMARLSHVSSPQKVLSSDYSLNQRSPSPLGVKSRTLQIAEESLNRLKLEDEEEEEEEDTSKVTPFKSIQPALQSNERLSFLSHVEPQTPSFRGMKTMFNNHPQTPQTPSFVGLKDMYKVPQVMATPNMKLDELFQEEGEIAQEIRQSADMETENHDKPSIDKVAFQPPKKRGLRRKAVPEQPAHSISETTDADIQPIIQSGKRVTRKMTEPLVEVHNNGDYVGDTNQADVAAKDTLLPRRVTRSRSTKSPLEESQVVKQQPAKRATRQAKKQQGEEVKAAVEDELGKTRRGRAKQSIVQIKVEDEVESVPKTSNRRRTRLK